MKQQPFGTTLLYGKGKNGKHTDCNLHLLGICSRSPERTYIAHRQSASGTNIYAAAAAAKAQVARTKARTFRCNLPQKCIPDEAGMPFTRISGLGRTLQSHQKKPLDVREGEGVPWCVAVAPGGQSAYKSYTYTIQFILGFFRRTPIKTRSPRALMLLLLFRMGFLSSAQKWKRTIPSEAISARSDRPATQPRSTRRWKRRKKCSRAYREMRKR